MTGTKEATTTIPKIYAAINKVMKDLKPISKGRSNVQQGYKFRGIDDMYNVLNPLLVESGVFATSEVVDTKREEHTSKSGSALYYTVLTMKFTFFAQDGSWVSSTTVGEAMDTADKSANKAMSTAYKYALMQLFCIPTEDEKDTEYQSHEVKPKIEMVTPQQIIELVDLLAKKGHTEKELCIKYKVESKEKLTKYQANQALIGLAALPTVAPVDISPVQP